MSSVDSQKRHTLKTLASSGLAVVAGSVGIAGLADAAVVKQTVALPPPVSAGDPDLSLTIFSSQSVVESSLILRNNTNSSMSIEKFIGGTIVFNNLMLSLNDLNPTTPIVLKPTQQRSILVNVQALDDKDLIEYVWADAYTSAVGPHAQVVELGGFMVDSSVIVYAAPAGLSKPVAA